MVIMSPDTSRLDALQQLGLLDTPASESFDRITRMASQIFDLPIAAVSLTDTDRQWFKSRVGVEHRSIPRGGGGRAAGGAPRGGAGALPGGVTEGGRGARGAPRRERRAPTPETRTRRR